MILSEILDLVSIGSKLDEKYNDNENYKNDRQDGVNLKKAFSKAQAISAKAKNYMLQYPVACSDSITDMNTALNIAKQVEFDCARFYLLASGLDCVVDSTRKDTIQSHLNKLNNSSEAYKQKTGFSVNIAPATEEDIKRAQEALSYYDTPYVVSHESLLSKTVHSREVVETDVDEDEGDDESIIAENPLDGTKTNAAGGDNETNKEDVVVNNTAISDMMGKLSKTAPTVINVEFIINGEGGQKTIKVPLSFKSDLQFIPSSDIKDLIKDVDTPGKKLRTLIKLTSGEMNFFKDFLFAFDDARKDTEKERMIGRVPIMRQLMAAKGRYRFKSLVEGIPFFKKHLENWIAKKSQKDLPMCTIVVSDHEFETASGVSLNKALSGNNKIISHILDTYMLLGFAIIDDLNRVGYFFYNGEDGYYTVSMDKMGLNGNSNNSINNDLAKALASLSSMARR